MSSPFQVSVIIPVYNAEKFVERAILSAVNQAEVKEVIVVDDGFKDGALEICQQLAAQHSKIKLLRHKHGKNMGAGASRNLGILNARCDYIAFLDADDYFLPNRFVNTQSTFLSRPIVDVVYEPVGIEFLSPEARENFIKIKLRATQENADHFLSYPLNPLEGKALFHATVRGGNQAPCTDGITVKKTIIAKVGLFNAALRLHQDSEYWMRLSYTGYFSSTGIHDKAVAVRAMHDENRTYAQNPNTQTAFNQSLLAWATRINIEPEYFKIILARYQNSLQAAKNA